VVALIYWPPLLADSNATGKPAAHMVNPVFIQKAAILSAQQGGRGDYYRRLQLKKKGDRYFGSTGFT
jgi:hypothetical protein